MPIRDDVTAFKLDLKRFGDQIGVGVSQVRRKVALDLLSKIIDRTPVDTGRLLMSWVVTDGVPSEYVPPDGGTGGDAAAAAAAARANIIAEFREPFDVTWLASNLPYAPRIEFGYSAVKAPAGMVRVSIAEIEVELEAYLDSLR